MNYHLYLEIRTLRLLSDNCGCSCQAATTGIWMSATRKNRGMCTFSCLIFLVRESAVSIWLGPPYDGKEWGLSVWREDVHWVLLAEDRVLRGYLLWSYILLSWATAGSSRMALFQVVNYIIIKIITIIISVILIIYPLHSNDRANVVVS